MTQVIPEVFVFIPPVISAILLALNMVLTETKFVGRGMIAVNSFLLWQIFLPQWENLELISQIYINASILFTLLAIFFLLDSYIPQVEEIPKRRDLLELGYLLYSSKTILGLWIGQMLGVNFLVSLLFSAAIWAFTIYNLEHKLPFVEG